MTLLSKPIPSCYCVYLLRSKNHQSSFYIGSTPNPRRRLNQHNGSKDLGAKQTRKLQPWTMIAVVMGFPSQVSALQFEWAWQNAHLTRHLPEEQRLTFRGANRRTKKGNPKPAQTRKTLSSSLKKLVYLLQAKSFGRLHLEVRFFAKQAFDAWETLKKNGAGTIRNDIKVTLDDRGFETQDNPVRQLQAPSAGTSALNANEPVGIDAIDVKYTALKPHLQKSIAILATGPVSCTLCGQNMNKDADMILSCPGTGCSLTTHLACLSNKFLDTDQGDDPVLPVKGKCPSCGASLSWSELMKDLSLRSRGRAQVEALMKSSKQKQAKSKAIGSELEGLEFGDALEEAQSIISVVVDDTDESSDEQVQPETAPPRRALTAGDIITISSDEVFQSDSEMQEPPVLHRNADAIPAEILNSDWDDIDDFDD